MEEKSIGLAELKNTAMGFDRAEMRDLHIIKDSEDYLSKRYMGVWNVDRNELACIAPKNYMVIQHRYATDCIINALASLNINADATLKKSRHGVHIDFDFKDSKFELTEVGESFTTGIRVVADYSQVAGLVISPRITRLACSNGMIVTEVVKSQRIRYTEELTITVEGLIDRMVKDIIANDEKLANMVSICMRDSVEWQTCKLLAKALFRRKKHVHAILSKIKLDEGMRVSRWQFYNAVTEFCTKAERLKPHVDAWVQNKAQKILKTPFVQLTEEFVKAEAEQA